MTKESIDIHLGDEAKDSVTGYRGIVTCKSVYLNGCVRVGLQSQELREGKPIDSYYFDIEQVVLIERSKVLMSDRSGGPEQAPKRAADPKR